MKIVEVTNKVVRHSDPKPKLSKPVTGREQKHPYTGMLVGSKTNKGMPITEAEFDEAAGEKDACYHKVKSRYKVWPSAYASGALVKCRKVGAKNWGNSSNKKK